MPLADISLTVHVASVWELLGKVVVSAVLLACCALFVLCVTGFDDVPPWYVRIVGVIGTMAALAALWAVWFA